MSVPVIVNEVTGREAADITPHCTADDGVVVVYEKIISVPQGAPQEAVDSSEQHANEDTSNEFYFFTEARHIAYYREADKQA